MLNDVSSGFDKGIVQHSEADITRARRDLGFDPKVSLEEGLRRTLAWIRASKGL